MLDAEELNWSLRRSRDPDRTAAVCGEIADAITTFLREIAVRRASGTGSHWGKIEDELSTRQREAVEVVQDAFIDEDIVRWLVREESHIRDAEHYMRYLENLAAKLSAIQARLLAGGRPTATTAAPALRHRWLRELFGDNLLAICDVVTDIRTERQLSGNTLEIPLFQNVIKFEQLLPADSSSLRDRYCELRWKAVKLLEANGALTQVSLVDGGHRWDSVIRATVSEPVFSEVVAVMEDEWANRTTEDEEPVVSDEPVVLLRKLLHRFHAVACQLLERREGRPTLAISDEYDVQDLLHALVRMHFDDVRPEEWTPSYAGKSSRVDFYLKPEKIVIEAKKTRAGLGAKEVGDQLIIDTRRYSEMSGCQTLICFVYDPEGLLKNPRGFERDLSGKRDGLSVEVIVAPRHY
jgi:hypothetical protein